MKRYRVDVRWLRGDKHDGVALGQELIKSVLARLDGTPLLDGPRCGFEGEEGIGEIGRVETDGPAMCCLTEHDLTGKRPGLVLNGQTAKFDSYDNSKLVLEAEGCALFVTDEDNGNLFFELEGEA